MWGSIATAPGLANELNEYQVATYVADMVTLLARLDVETIDW
jgi:hypothetical protein